MAKFCQNCGTEIVEGASFCTKCGANVGGEGFNTYKNANHPVLPERNIALAIVLSFLTCGIYGIYWFVVMTDEANLVSEEKTASGGLAIVYTLITCGIYSFYWNYKMGQKLAEAGRKYEKGINDNGVLYLVLSLFGLQIVNYCLIQSDLNRFSK